METLAKRALIGVLRFQLALAALNFVPAFSLTFWQGWLYWFVVLGGSLGITLFFLRHDPALIERRMKDQGRPASAWLAPLPFEQHNDRTVTVTIGPVASRCPD